MRATIFWSLTSIFYSIYQTACKNKVKPYQCKSNHKAKFITFFIWPWRTSENVFKVESLAHVKIWGNVRS